MIEGRRREEKKHKEKLMNVENDWSDSIDATKVEGAVRRIEVAKGVVCNESNKNRESKWALWGCSRIL